MAELDKQIEAFSARLGQIRADHGSGWIVFFDHKVLGAFPTFAEAADFAFEAYGDIDYLIRHTYPEPAFAPFLLVK